MEKVLCCAMLGALSFGMVALQSTAASAQALEDLFDNAADNPRLFLGYGTQHIGSFYATYTHQGYFDPEADEDERAVRNSYGIGFDAAMFPFPTMFGSMGGLEASMALVTPFFGSFFGGLRASVGIVLNPLPLEHIRFTVAMGVGMGGHRHAYVKPRLALNLPGPLEAEVSYRWVPAVASRIFGEEQQLGELGFEERRLRGNLWINIKPSDGELDSMMGLHLFTERTELSSDDMELLAERHAMAGTFWTFGVGWSF